MSRRYVVRLGVLVYVFFFSWKKYLYVGIECMTLQGRNWVVLRGGRRNIYDWKVEIIHGLSPSVKCDMSLAKYEMQEGERAPSALPPVAPLIL